MDIAGLSVVLSQSKVQQQASLSVMKMAMDTAKGNSEAMKELLNTTGVQAAQPHLGNKIDIKV